MTLVAANNQQTTKPKSPSPKRIITLDALRKITAELTALDKRYKSAWKNTRDALLKTWRHGNSSAEAGRKTLGRNPRFRECLKQIHKARTRYHPLFTFLRTPDPHYGLKGLRLSMNKETAAIISAFVWAYGSLGKTIEPRGRGDLLPRSHYLGLLKDWNLWEPKIKYFYKRLRCRHLPRRGEGQAWDAAVKMARRDCLQEKIKFSPKEWKVIVNWINSDRNTGLARQRDLVATIIAPGLKPRTVIDRVSQARRIATA